MSGEYVISIDFGHGAATPTLAFSERQQKLGGREGRRMSGPDLIYTAIQTLRLEEMNGMTFAEIADRVAELSQRPLLAQQVDVVINSTEVGDGVIEVFRSQIPQCRSVRLTSGTTTSNADNDYQVPRREVAMALLLWYESDRIRVNKGHDRDADGRRQKELYGRFAERLQFFAQSMRSRKSDDEAEEDSAPVMALALGCWWMRTTYGFEEPQLPEEAYPSQQENYDPFSALRSAIDTTG